MVYALFTSLPHSSLPSLLHHPNLIASRTSLKLTTHPHFLNAPSNHLSRLTPTTTPPPLPRHLCFFSGGGGGNPKPDSDDGEGLQILKRLTTATILGVLYTVASTFQPLPRDIYRYDWREPFSLQRGWLLWAGVGLVGAVAAVAVTGAVTAFFSGGTPEREKDALVSLLPLLGSSSISTACLLGITGVFAPVLEETVFRGFLMVSLTKWVPTPVAVVISAAVFALAHLTPGEFPQLFVLGAAMGLSYAQTRNLLTPITIHALWNSGVILLLTFLQLQGYDIKELLQTT